MAKSRRRCFGGPQSRGFKGFYLGIQVLGCESRLDFPISPGKPVELSRFEERFHPPNEFLKNAISKKKPTGGKKIYSLLLGVAP